MDPGELLELVGGVFRDLRIDYFVTGSTATIAYGEPRFANDIDLVVRLKPDHVDGLAARSPGPTFYLAKESMQRALRGASSFDLIHPGSRLKVDFMVAGDTSFNASRFGRVQLL